MRVSTFIKNESGSAVRRNGLKGKKRGSVIFFVRPIETNQEGGGGQRKHKSSGSHPAITRSHNKRQQNSRTAARTQRRGSFRQRTHVDLSDDCTQCFVSEDTHMEENTKAIWLKPPEREVRYIIKLNTFPPVICPWMTKVPP